MKNGLRGFKDDAKYQADQFNQMREKTRIDALEE